MRSPRSRTSYSLARPRWPLRSYFSPGPVELVCRRLETAALASQLRHRLDGTARWNGAPSSGANIASCASQIAVEMDARSSMRVDREVLVNLVTGSSRRAARQPARLRRRRPNRPRPQHRRRSPSPTSTNSILGCHVTAIINQERGPNPARPVIPQQAVCHHDHSIPKRVKIAERDEARASKIVFNFATLTSASIPMLV